MMSLRVLDGYSTGTRRLLDDDLDVGRLYSLEQELNMAWNDSGNGNGSSGGGSGGSQGSGSGNRNPWGKRPQQGPPDLDQVFRNFQRKLSGLFGGGGKRPTDTGSGGGGAGAGL